MSETRPGFFLLSAIIIAGLLAGFGLPDAFGAGSTQNLSSQVVVGNAAPTVSAVGLNAGSAIVLTPNATTSFSVNFTVQDANGCGDVFFNGGVTTTVYRSGVGGACSASDLNCYITATVATHTCASATTTNQTANATATVSIYYFAQATDASSSFSGENWIADVTARDAANSTHTATSTGVELNTLTAINVTTSSINYGTLAAGVNTGSTNQTATTTNAGNSTTTLQVSAFATLTSGSNSISTSSQRYSTSSFTYAGTSTALTASGVTVTGLMLTNPTSTSAVQRATFWGLDVPGGTATGTYTGTNVFSSLWQP
jgi:hypothetical protein